MKSGLHRDHDIVNHLLSEDLRLREEAWKSLYFKNYIRIKKFVRKYRGSEENAVDVFHDGLLILSKNIREGIFKGESSISTYLFSICKNIWFRQIKKTTDIKFTNIEIEKISELNDEENTIENSKLIESFLDQLSIDCKDILIDFYYRKKTMKELKEKFNLSSIQAAKNKKCRCLSYLVSLLKENGIKIEAFYYNG